LPGIEQRDLKILRGQLEGDGTADQSAADQHYIETLHKLMIAGIE
jgi:hypothetical protein